MVSPTHKTLSSKFDRHFSQYERRHPAQPDSFTYQLNITRHGFIFSMSRPIHFQNHSTFPEPQIHSFSNPFPR